MGYGRARSNGLGEGRAGSQGTNGTSLRGAAYLADAAVPQQHDLEDVHVACRLRCHLEADAPDRADNHTRVQGISTHPATHPTTPHFKRTAGHMRGRASFGRQHALCSKSQKLSPKENEV